MKKTAIFGIVAMIMLSAYAVYAQRASSELNTDANVQGYIGTLCLQPQGFPDIYVLRFDKVGDAYQVTGGDAPFGSAVDGGGMQYGTDIYLTMDEAVPDYEVFGEHSIKLNLTKFNAEDSVRFSTLDGNVYLNYSRHPFDRVSCPPPGAVLEKGKSFTGK